MTGKWAFDYSILPFAGPESPEVYQQAYAFVSPLRAAERAGPGRGSAFQGVFPAG